MRRTEFKNYPYIGDSLNWFEGLEDKSLLEQIEFAMYQCIEFLQFHYSNGDYQGSKTFQRARDLMYARNDKLQTSGEPPIRFNPNNVGIETANLRYALENRLVGVTLFDEPEWELSLKPLQDQITWASFRIPLDIREFDDSQWDQEPY